MDDALTERVEALERAVTDGDHDLSSLTAEADALDRLEAVETQLTDIEDRLGELEAATQALRGYVGNVRSVNREVEQRAAAALAKAESLEAAVGEQDGSPNGTAGTATDTTTDTTPAVEARSDTGTRQHGKQFQPDTPPGTTETTPDGGGTGAGQQRQSADTDNSDRHGQSADDPHRCHACGQSRLGTDQHRPRGSSAPGESQQPGTSRSSDAFTPGENEGLVPEDDPLVSDTSEDDTGGLQRIRELL